MGDRHHFLRLLTAALVVIGSALVVAPAAADDTPGDYGDTVHVIQPKPVLQQGRFNLTPRFGMTINDALYRNFKFSTNASFHISERLFLGALFQWYDFGSVLGGPTETYRTLNAETSGTADGPFLNWAAGGEIGFVPIFGKFALFNRGIIFYDISVTAGGGVADASRISEPGISNSGGAGTLSISTRAFLNEWMAVNLEVRDVIYHMFDDRPMSHSVTVGLGMSFYLPMSFEYSD